MFTTEFNFFKDNQERLVQQYGEKTLAILGEEVIGVYECEGDAYEELQEKTLLGKAMIQNCSSGRDAYTVSIATIGLIPE